MHERWLVGIYDWAGRYRSVNMQKDGFPFAAATRIEPLMALLEADALKRCTPCRFQNTDEIAHAGTERTNYFAAVQAGIDRNYTPMCAIFAQIISATPAAGK
jgi:fido (protein-threonine AMPylation protein)